MRNERPVVAKGNEASSEAASCDTSAPRPVQVDGRVSAPEEGITARIGVPEGLRTGRMLAGTAQVLADGRTSAAILRKLQWLDGVLRGAHEVVRRFNDERASLLWESGTDSGYYIDWRAVQHNCAPELIVVVRRDPSRLVFDEHPYAVIVPLVGLSWSLMSEHWLEEILACIPLEQRDEAVVALNTLDGIARNMDPKKRSNAMSVLATAKRLFQSS